MLKSLWITTRWALLPFFFGSIALNIFLPELYWSNELFHVFIEAGGALLAFGLAFVVYAMVQKQQIGPNHTWLIYAFVVMGALDLVHSQAHPGQAFVWLHSVATLLGGFFALLIWLPDRISIRFHRPAFFVLALLVSAGFSLFSMEWPQYTLRMLDEAGAFTFEAKVLNFVGGLGFFLSWLYFSRVYMRSHDGHSSYFSNHFLLFAIAGALFEISLLWDGNWWFWHMMRAFAYVLLLVHFSQVYRDTLLLDINRSEQVFEQSLNEIYMFDPKTLKFVEVNRSARENLGYSLKELRAMTAFEINPQVSEAEFREMLAPLLKGAVPKLQFVASHQRKDASVYPVEVHLQVTEDEPRLCFAIVLDITERLHKQHELEAQTRFNKTVLASAGNVIVVLDMEGRIVTFNHAAEELTGFKQKDIIGKPVWDYVIPEEQLASVRKVFALLKDGEEGFAGRYENEWLTRTGERRLLQWNNSVLRDNEGNVNYVVALGYDITEQRAVDRERSRLQSELQQSQKMESLGHLTGGIAHDFNNLLGIINGYASIAATIYGEEDEKLGNYLSRIQDAGDRAEKLVKQMLTFSRSGEFVDEAIDLKSVVEDDIKLLRSSLPSTIEIVTVIDEELPAVLINSTYINQILMNLAINARDAMNGSGVLTISLKVWKSTSALSSVSHKAIEGDWVAMTVSDTGMGIPKEILHKIFNPFFTTKEVGKGTGMGLSVVYRIMEDHNGHILIESDPGRGAIFTLLFQPLSESEVKSGTLVDDGEVVVVDGGGVEVLVVDDEESLAEHVSELLAAHGYRAQLAYSAIEAIEIFQRDPKRFAALITDQTMPKMTGLELIERIRDIIPDFPAVMCTGYSDKIDAQSAEEKNIVFLQKPMNSARFMQELTKLGVARL